MAERKQGPVKPPVIDLKANAATPEAGRPADGSSAPKPATPAKSHSAPAETPAPPLVIDVEAKPVDEPKPEIAASAEIASEAQDKADPDIAAPESTAEAPEAVATDVEVEKPVVEAGAPEPETQKPDLEPKPEPVAEKLAPKEPEPPHPTYTPLPHAAEPKPATISPVLLVAGGAVLGTALTLVLAALGWFPARTPEANAEVAVLTQRLATIEQTAQANVSGLADFNDRVDALEADLGGKLAAATSGLDAVRQSIAALPQGSSPAVDTTSIDQQLQALSDRIDAIAAGADPADATALGQNIEALQRSLAALTTEIDTIKANAMATDESLAGVDADLKLVQTGLADAQTKIANPDASPIAQMPLILSGLEDAFATGRPFAAELASLQVIKPDSPIPPSVAAAAETGLSRPEILAAHFAEILPAIIAARPADPEASWQDAALNWAKSVLALRPADEQAGSSPEALVSQLEAAMTRRDYAAAAALLAQLPPPMQIAAADLPAELSAHADAGAFIADLRGTALAATTETAP